MTDAPLLAGRDVRVTFGGLHAVDGVSVSIEEGSIVGLLGPNGAGKTTLFNVISGLQKPTSGQILLRGRDITSFGPSHRARLGIGRSFQNLGLMTDQTVETNVLAGQFMAAGYGVLDPILLPWRWRRQERELRCRVSEILDRFGLAPYRHALVSDLSFGVARFVELASVLLLGPDVLLLDEPTTGLDMAETERLHELLCELRSEGKTILLVAHNVAFVMGLCDRVYVQANGRRIFEGKARDAQRCPEVVTAYLGAAAS